MANTQPTINTERTTQNRVIRSLCDFGGYHYLGDLRDSENLPYREEILRQFLTEKQACTPKQANEAIKKLSDLVAQCRDHNTLYTVNKSIYQLLRKPTAVSQGLGRTNRTVSLIDWQHPENNFYHIAEEVTVSRTTDTGEHRRPDVVIYINGIAVCIIELKKASVSAHEGIRQQYRNQADGQIPQFFATAQLLLAGNESEGVYYGTTLTPENFYLRWKEPAGEHYQYADGKPDPYTTPYPVTEFDNLLDRTLLQMLDHARLLEFLHDCIIFDGGVKKVARPNQYFALHACKQRCRDKANGIIWHSQGSGKSLTMVWLAQWIIENITDARVVVITDRDELDQQITQGFADADIQPAQAKSGKHLIDMLEGKMKRDRQGKSEDYCPNLITTLIHKFGVTGRVNDPAHTIRGRRSPEYYLQQVADRLPEGFQAKGNLYVFVDECHRTQGGVLNQAMRKIMGDNVMLIGFTGTPLLHSQKNLTSREAFGPWISTYKFDEAVADNVIRDLRYEARSIDQELDDKTKFDLLFEQKTSNLSKTAKSRLQQRWATMQNMHSSIDRITKICRQVGCDFQLIPCLREGWGNAMLVADSVYQAFRYWECFQSDKYFEGHTAVITSYEGDDPTLREGFTGQLQTEEETKNRLFHEMLTVYNQPDGEKFEKFAKNQFIKYPAQMKILIVVDKLLTGFDAPAATYMYLDSVLHNHTLFQAICRVNRNNGERKPYGYIIDYKDLFNEISQAVSDYTEGEFEAFSKEDVEGLLKNRIQQGQEDLEKALTAVRRLTENVEQPRQLEQFCDYFCYDHLTCIQAEEQTAQIEHNLQRREDFYNACGNLVRCYASIALEMDKAGYSQPQADDIYQEVKGYDEMRQAIMHRSGDFFDVRQYDAEMRALLDNFVTAPHSETLAKLEDFSFLDLIQTKTDETEQGEICVDPDVENSLGGKKGVAETLGQNIRRVINRKINTNPAEYKRFSEKINRLLEDFQQDKIEYKELLKSILDIANELKQQERPDSRLITQLHVDLYNNLGNDIDLTLYVYDVISKRIKIGFRSNPMRMRNAQRAVQDALQGTEYDWQTIYNIIDAHSDFRA